MKSDRSQNEKRRIERLLESKSSRSRNAELNRGSGESIEASKAALHRNN
jgi:hypothetical protein